MPAGILGQMNAKYRASGQRGMYEFAEDREMTNQIQESGHLSVTVKPKESWGQKIAMIREVGERTAREFREEGHAFKVEILAPRELDDQVPIPLSAVKLEFDWKIATRLEMVEDARNILTRAFVLRSLDPGLPSVLAAIIEGRGLYEHGIGEFFLLYGKFEQKHGTSGKKTRQKMKKLINGARQHMKPYTERGTTTMEPLPYAVRNILAHTGTNPNSLDQNGADLKTSIELLRTWVA